MSQLALDLLLQVPPTLDNFIVGANQECLHVLRAVAGGQRIHRFVYLWGLPGCGRSHLARALGGAPPADLLVVDDVHRLGPEEQIALFREFIAAAAQPGRAIVTTGDRPPLALTLRDDLRSRLGAGLVFELQGLDDAARALALEQAAQARGVALSADLIPWLLTHHSRDMRVLLATLDALDRYALVRKRPITLPLLREWLAAPTGKML
jgi:DnaA family protein